ncbi:MAG: FHA domain-containing protein, partial [Deltaproteobacteria bacterium]|nr:FHA domain-containing protein [Deltaproteobacteria bacterium]
PAPAQPVAKPVFVPHETADRERVKKLGDRAAKDGVRIHSFAYAPTRQRRPLLALGELSRRSLGTFRFIDAREGWAPAMKQLRDEINQQYVLTYFLPAEQDLTGKKVKIVTAGRIESTSNDARIPALGCGGEPCEGQGGYCANERCIVPQQVSGRGIFGWIILLAGMAVLVLVTLSLIGFVISKVQARKIPLPPGVPPPPGSIPPGPPFPPGPPGKLGRGTLLPGSIPAPVAPPQPAPPQPVTSGPRLLVLSGPHSGETFAVKHGFTIGKVAGCDLIIEDGYTSSHHAQIHMDQFGNCRVFDLNSTNGTFANGVRVTDYALDHGASIRVGSTEIRFLSH